MVCRCLQTGSALNLLEQFNVFQLCITAILLRLIFWGRGSGKKLLFPTAEKTALPGLQERKLGAVYTDHLGKDLEIYCPSPWDGSSSSSKAGDPSFLSELRIQVGGKTCSHLRWGWMPGGCTKECRFMGLSPSSTASAG